MENVIEVSITTLEQDTTTMQETLTTLNNVLQEVDSIISSLNGMWDSEAKRVFMQHYENDKQAFLTMFDNVDEVINSMQNAKAAYSRCESSINEKIVALKI